MQSCQLQTVQQHTSKLTTTRFRVQQKDRREIEPSTDVQHTASTVSSRWLADIRTAYALNYVLVHRTEYVPYISCVYDVTLPIYVIILLLYRKRSGSNHHLVVVRSLFITALTEKLYSVLS